MAGGERSFGGALIASLALHALVLLGIAATRRPTPPPSPPERLVKVDLYVPPVPGAGHKPGTEERLRQTTAARATGAVGLRYAAIRAPRTARPAPRLSSRPTSVPRALSPRVSPGPVAPRTLPRPAPRVASPPALRPAPLPAPRSAPAPPVMARAPFAEPPRPRENLPPLRSPVARRVPVTTPEPDPPAAPLPAPDPPRPAPRSGDDVSRSTSGRSATASAGGNSTGSPGVATSGPGGSPAADTPSGSGRRLASDGSHGRDDEDAAGRRGNDGGSGDGGPRPDPPAPSVPKRETRPGPEHVNREAEMAEPVLTRDARPEVPDTLREQGVEGSFTVVVAYTVDEKGRVTDVSVVQRSGHRELDAAAVHAVKQLRYQPARQNGQPRPFKMTRRFTFRILQ